MQGKKLSVVEKTLKFYFIARSANLAHLVLKQVADPLYSLTADSVQVS